MSNRNFDHRVIIERLQNQNYSRNLYINNTNGQRIINNPQNSDPSSSKYDTYISGAQTEYFRGLLDGSKTVSIGGIVNIPPFPTISPTASIPSAPVITSIVPANQQLTVIFLSGSDGGSPLNDYEYSIDNGTTFISAGTTVSPIIIAGLINGTTYDVVIRAINAIGISPISNMLQGEPVTIPSAPNILSITPGNQQLIVYFTPPLDDGGSALINYEYSIDNGALFTGVSPSNIVSPITITGLINGTTYDIIIRAVNAIGVGTLSSMVQSTPGLFPEPPNSLSGVGGNEAIYILFTAGSDNNNAITNYQYSIDGGAFTDFSPAQTISPVLISDVGLTNDTTYSIKLKAVNAIGASAESLSVSVTPTVTALLGSNRIINLDSTNSSSYSGSGTTWTNLDSGGSYSATLNGPPTYNISNPSNKYFEFNTAAAGQFAQINQAAAINPIINTPFTIQMWAKINNIGSAGNLVSKVFGGPSYDGYALYYKANTSLELHENGASQVKYFTSPTAVLSSGWALYTANVQFGNGGGRTNKVFVNGRQVVNQLSNEIGIPSPTQNLTFPTGFGGEGECDIGAFYYYNTELTATQIIQNFDATKSRYNVLI